MSQQESQESQKFQKVSQQDFYTSGGDYVVYDESLPTGKPSNAPTMMPKKSTIATMMNSLMPSKTSMSTMMPTTMPSKTSMMPTQTSAPTVTVMKTNMPKSDKYPSVPPTTKK